MDRLHKIWWLWLPVSFIIFEFIFERFFDAQTLAIMMGEDGPHEMLQFLIIGAAALVALATLFRVNWTTQKWIGIWVGLAAVCCIYVAGEEISWGQHLLNWTTPEFWSAVNDQNETNLHNTSSWLDQKPRAILLIGIVIGGLILPLLRKYKPALVPPKFNIIYPPAILSTVALLAVSTEIIKKIDKALPDIAIFARISEVQEIYLFYFVLLYLIVLRRRILQG